MSGPIHAPVSSHPLQPLQVVLGQLLNAGVRHPLEAVTVGWGHGPIVSPGCGGRVKVRGRSVDIVGNGLDVFAVRPVQQLLP